MRFIPHTEADIAAMLATIGVASIDDLIAHVPADLRASAAIKLDAGRSELEVAAELAALALRNRGATEFVSFLGGGSYAHHIPAPVPPITPRAEFPTPFTPYPPHPTPSTPPPTLPFP